MFWELKTKLLIAEKAELKQNIIKIKSENTNILRVRAHLV